MDETPNLVRPLWQRRWFQVLLAVLLGLLVLSFIVPPIFAVIYELRSILAPVLIGFGLAYVVNPVITYLDVRRRVPRWASAAGIMGLGLLIVVIFLLLVVPPLVAQGTDLILKVKDVYSQELVEFIGQVTPDAESPPADAESPASGAAPATPDAVGDAADTATDQTSSDATGNLSRREKLTRSLTMWIQTLDWSTVSGTAVRSLGIGVGVVGSAISFTTYILLALVIIAFCFFYFAWKFSQVTGWFTSFIPATRRDTALDMIRKMDRSVNAFIRGRLVQAAVMMAVLSVGWWAAGVPYFLLLGILSGLLNLVPFLVVIGWIVALVLTIVDHSTGAHGFTLWTILGPTIVYVFAQSLDGWVVEPVVQGRATNLDPLTVLLVVLVGGALAGLLGMLLAIPVAACIKILSTELILPRLRRLAAEN